MVLTGRLVTIAMRIYANSTMRFDAFLHGERREREKPLAERGLGGRVSGTARPAQGGELDIFGYRRRDIQIRDPLSGFHASMDVQASNKEQGKRGGPRLPLRPLTNGEAQSGLNAN